MSRLAWSLRPRGWGLWRLQQAGRNLGLNDKLRRALRLAARLILRAPEWSKTARISDRFAALDLELERLFADEAVSDRDRYDFLFNYFLTGFLKYSTPGGERVHYPGIRGNRGAPVEGLEGFARTAPLFAAWLASGRPSVVQDLSQPPQQVDLPALLRCAILGGTDRNSKSYWGDIADYDQRIVEAADVALILWLSREHVWRGFSRSERQQVATWLTQAASGRVYANNWLLFVVLINQTLRALGMPFDEADSRLRYQQFKNFYLEEGWFDDPPKGVDFYNAWGISYSLFWIDQVSPAFDRGFIRDVLRKSGDLVLHLVSPKGIPIMGRSQCYRMAVVVPVILQPAFAESTIPAGQARRALDAVWKHFIEHQAVRHGRVEQGYYGSDPRLLDHYSGTGSCQWSLRSLVLAFFHTEQSDFWRSPQHPLPIETEDYRLVLPRLGWTIQGCCHSSEIVIRISVNGDQHHKLREHSMTRRLAEHLFSAPFRPANDKAFYKNGAYSSRLRL